MKQCKVAEEGLRVRRKSKEEEQGGRVKSQS